MIFFKFFLFSMLIGLSYQQGLRGFFDTLARPFSGFTDGFRRLFPKPMADVPDNEKLDKDNCACRLSASARIVGGKTASDTIPWQTALVHASNSTLFCGGTIVNNWYVITTAHCTDNKRPENIRILVGLKNLKDSDSRRSYAVSKIYQGSYRSTSSPGDIAILKLNRSIEFSFGQVEPGCLNLVGKSRYDGELMASGFGTTSPSYQDPNGTYHSGQLSPTLKKAYFVEDRSGCRSFLICINSKNGDSACNGDSGGPLHYLEQGITSVEGGASFVRGKGKRSERIYLCTGFAGYTRFSYYSNWIESIVGQEYCTREQVIKKEDTE